MDDVRALAREFDGILCVDEAYADFADDNAVMLVAEHDNVVVLRTLSKSYSLAGARVGLGFAQPDIISGLSKVKDSYNLSRMAIAAGTAALLDAEWTRDNIRKVRSTRARLIAELRTVPGGCLHRASCCSLHQRMPPRADGPRLHLPDRSGTP